MSAAFDDQFKDLGATTPAIHVAQPAGRRATRYLWAGLGTASLSLGVIGVVLPGWPTTIFLIVAAACYARSSQRMYDRILANPVFGPQVRRFRETGGIPLRAKVLSLALMWPFVALSVFVAIPAAMHHASMHWVQALALLLALTGTAFILSRPTDRGAPEA